MQTNQKISASGYVNLKSLDSISEITVSSGQRAVLECVRYNIATRLLADLCIRVEQGAIVEFVILDLTDTDTDFKITAEMANHSLLTIKLGSLSSKSCKKNYDFNVEQYGRKSKSLVSMLGVAQGHSEMVFTGATRIYKGAVKSEARQEARIADLSSETKVSASPALLIDENDIVASHGTALGKIEENQLFYLMSRGLTQEEAETIITLGYLKPIIALLQSERSQSELNEYIESKVKRNA